MDLLKKLAALLGLPDTATEDEVLAAVKGLKTTSAALKDKAPAGPAVMVLKALDLPADAGEDRVVAAIHVLKLRPDADLVAEVAALKQRELDRETDALITAALKDGKLAPSQETSARQFAAANFPAFRDWIGAAPVVVPLKDLGFADPKTRTDAGGGGWTPEQEAVIRQFGHDPRELKQEEV